MTDKEFSDMAAMAVNIANHESNFGNSKRYKLKRYTPDFIIGLGKKAIIANNVAINFFILYPF